MWSDLGVAEEVQPVDDGQVLEVGVGPVGRCRHGRHGKERAVPRRDALLGRARVVARLDEGDRREHQGLQAQSIPTVVRVSISLSRE